MIVIYFSSSIFSDKNLIIFIFVMVVFFVIFLSFSSAYTYILVCPSYDMVCPSYDITLPSRVTSVIYPQKQENIYYRLAVMKNITG